AREAVTKSNCDFRGVLTFVGIKHPNSSSVNKVFSCCTKKKSRRRSRFAAPQWRRHFRIRKGSTRRSIRSIFCLRISPLAYRLCLNCTRTRRAINNGSQENAKEYQNENR